VDEALRLNYSGSHQGYRPLVPVLVRSRVTREAVVLDRVSLVNRNGVKQMRTVPSTRGSSERRPKEGARPRQTAGTEFYR